ncbi:putative Dolichyl-diphosphooligosaccharide--protein glycosyltransferase 48 kDa subunit [Paratrimastix pyriformis]|uniref:Dolichyl-diphosphooligosaccharide--protein glycosyltransferase 48 kDa subunit n=1 Tax=Paratrimastix pyriformis TaxID=342808 RepID=A0ABQ8UM99_9EUKA|nr:putative Dolichyl-diphosphooligosaccharide--protein glycosyltransferase 48 kDa subunit [Paratrimastix pyriformis]
MYVVSVARGFTIMHFFRAFLFTLICAALASERVLVLHDASSIQSTHSKFFKGLKDHGMTLTFKSIESSEAGEFTEFGEYLYDSVIVFAPEADELPKDQLNQFLDDKHNVLIISSESDGVKDWLEEINIRVDESADSETVVSATPLDIPVIVGPNKIGQVSISGFPLTVSSLSSPETVYYPVLSADGKVYSYALQTRVDGRVMVVSSLQFFSDDSFTETPANAQLAHQLAMWTFGRRGNVRAVDVEYRVLSNPPPCSEVVPPMDAFLSNRSAVNPAVLSVNDFVRFSFRMEERVMKEGKPVWVPFVRPGEAQLEFTMLNPRLRTVLDVDLNGVYSAQFRAPDVYGIYKFGVNYHAPGYNPLNVVQKVSVRPYRHNAFERFIPCAYPYYASAFAAMGAVFLFAATFLLLKPAAPKRD